MRHPIKVLCVTADPDLPETNTMVRLADLGFAMRVLCEPDARNFALLERSRVAVAPLSISRRFDAAAVTAIRAELAAFDPEILHLYNNRAVLNGLRAARGHAAKIVAYRGNVGNVSVLDPLAWLRYLNPRVDRIVCVADAVRDSLRAVGFPGCRIPAAKLVTIRKGHDLAWYATPAADRASFGVPADAFVVGCVANWRPRKGIELLVEAAERLSALPDLHLVLVGDLGRSGIERRLAQGPLVGRAHVLGPRSDAAAIAGAFDVAVLPATKREGLPKTVIESMARGVATIASRVGGVPEIIVDGVSGVIVPPGDVASLEHAIARLQRDPELRLRMGAAGRARIATALRLEDTVRLTAALYTDLVDAA